MNASNKRIVFVVILVIVAVAYFLLKNEEPKTGEPADSTSQLEDNAPVVASQTKTVSFDYIFPSKWELKDKVTAQINTMTPGQGIVEGVLTNPLNKNYVYFATSKYDSETNKMLVGVYELRLDPFQWERLYKQEFAVGGMNFSGKFNLVNGGDLPLFHVYGFESLGGSDEGRLIILVQPVDDSPGPCSETLLLDTDNGARSLVSMELSDPYGGFKDYTLPEDVVSAAEERSRVCLEELDW